MAGNWRGAFSRKTSSRSRCGCVSRNGRSTDGLRWALVGTLGCILHQPIQPLVDADALGDRGLAGERLGLGRDSLDLPVIPRSHRSTPPPLMRKIEIQRRRAAAPCEEDDIKAIGDDPFHGHVARAY